VRLETVDRAEDYLPTISRLLDDTIVESAFDLCIYNAGMDPFESSEIGALNGITREILATRERLVFDRCAGTKTPIAFVLAGGYIGADFDQAALVDLHRLTLEESARAR
jgi:acetoin utilization deacetylase AcuC-like enzyme